MTTTTNPQIQQYVDNAARFTEVVEAGGTWSGESPCEGWTATDVLDHVVDTQRSFLEQRGVDLGERPTGEPTALWAAHLSAVRDVLADEELVTAEYDGYFGRTSVADTLANFYGFDMLVHRWDLARGLGRDVPFSDAELDLADAALDGFGDALYSDGVCKPALAVPADAPRQERLLARMGRRA
jgi:uncharacterized protein (TIGR03086 family)